MHSRRALLYMPGNEIRKIEKAASLPVDCICMDLEDGTALNKKAEARQVIIHALKNVDFHESERVIRFNPTHSPYIHEDLQILEHVIPDAIVLPKAHSAEEVIWLDQEISGIERRCRKPEGTIRLLLIIETALAFVNLSQICSSVARLDALIFGAEDLAADIGATRTLSGTEIFHARSQTVLYAAAFHLQAIDMVNNDFRDLENLKKEAEEGAIMGYVGKQIIHPNQVEIVQKTFTPDDASIAKAMDLVCSHKKHKSDGRGEFAIERKMVDMPVVKAAENVIARAIAAGKITSDWEDQR